MTKLTAVEDNKKTLKRFLRSVRLESDISDYSNLYGYTLTNHILHVLGRIEEGLANNNSERAWTLTGPYGSGKSAFALFLAQLLSHSGQGKSNIAFKMLKDQDPKLAQHFKSFSEERGLYPIALTLRRAPLSTLILEGLLDSLKNERQSKMIKKLIADINSDLLSQQLDTHIIIQRLNSFNRLLAKKYQGCILILDELGKVLEYASRHTSEDVYLLQELAEHAARSKEYTFLLVGILHQAFEQYGEYLDQAAKIEWAKVQGRFCDIAFIEPPEQQIRLAAQAISTPMLKLQRDELKPVADVASLMFDNGYIPNGLKQAEIRELSITTYPLHVSVLIALPYLFKKFAQNQRSLFAYLLSNEPFGLQELKNENRIIRLPDLFDYFSINVSANMSKHISSRRWHEISDALVRIPDLTLEETKVLKTIGLIDLIGDTSYLPAKSDLISFALYDEINNHAVHDCLMSLQKKSIIIYRRYNQTYKIWEGSDVDLEARLEEGHRKNQSLNLADVLQRFLPNRPLVARKHSHKYGAMRFFEIRYVDSASLADFTLQNKELDGTIICCLPGTQGHNEDFKEWVAEDKVASLNNVVIVIPQQIGSLRDAASELRAIHWVWQNTPELRDDRIARRELAERTSLFEQVLTQAVHKLFDPRPEPLGSGAEWYYMGQKKEVERHRNISELLSSVMDNLFSKSPKIRNELINRRTVSSAASAARRNLIEKMLTNSDETSLGIAGYPPEKSIYESVLKVSGIHQSTEPYWQLPQAGADPLNLEPSFNYMKNRIFCAIEEPVSINSLLYELTKPPYGIMAGVFPVLFVALLQNYPDEISLYREGVFIPDPGIADFEVLMRRPEFYAVAGSLLRGERSDVVKRISSSLNIKPTTLSVTRAIINMVRQLPDHAWKTRHLPEESINLRAAIEQAKSPERLLFVDIPKALGERPFKGEKTNDHERIERFFIKLNTALQDWSSITQDRITQAGDIILKACNLTSGEQGWYELIEIAKQLDEKPLDDLLKPFIKRLIIENDLEAVVESVIALIANRPPRSWTDQEVENFPALAQQIGSHFVIAKEQYNVLSPNDEIICEELVEKLKLQIDEKVSPHIKNAAIVRLLQQQK